jgi:hypothetical protein
MKWMNVPLVCACVFCLILETPSRAQDQPNEIRCSGASPTCTAGTIPVFSTSGGSATVRNSKVKQISSGITVTGNISLSGFVNAGGTVFGKAGTFTGDLRGGTVFGSAGSFSGNVSAGGTVSGTTGNFSGDVFGNNGSFSGNLFGTVGSLNNLSAGAGTALFAENNDTFQTVQLNNVVAPSDSSFMEADFNGFGDAVFFVTTLGSTVAKGTKSAAVPLSNGKMVKMFAVESSEVWFDDYGTASLVGGVATVNLDRTFAQTVSTRSGYKVFLTPNGDCHGLFVAQRTRTSFEVRELGGGSASVSFDYRIVAHRKGYEKERMSAAVIPKQLSTAARPIH